MRWNLNQDCCPDCGMSGLEMLQKGIVPHNCDPERRVAYAVSKGWNEENLRKAIAKKEHHERR